MECRFPNAIWGRAPVGTSLRSVNIPDDKPLTRGIRKIAKPSNLWPRDSRSGKTITFTKKGHVCAFSEIVPCRRQFDRWCNCKIQRIILKKQRHYCKNTITMKFSLLNDEEISVDNFFDLHVTKSMEVASIICWLPCFAFILI